MSVTKLAITMGDPRGVGPEIINHLGPKLGLQYAEVEFICVGQEGLDPQIGRYINTGVFEGTESSAGIISALSIEKAVSLAMEGVVSGIVTGPISKPALKAAGIKYIDHTSMLCDITNSTTVGMLMSAENTPHGFPLRVSLATTHMPFKRVTDSIHKNLLVSQGKLLHHNLRKFWNIQNPRIAFCALNPHASDEGLFGDEEELIFRPALRELVDMGIKAYGPFPADTVLLRALNGNFDAVIAPYHDVGMAAFKTATF